ncbi:MAG: dTDP-4-dehydrorhamnose reductase [Methanoregula sp.]
MKILVTGAKGQLGQDMVNLCSSRNFSVFAADSMTLDITNKDRIDEFMGKHTPEIIINCAAYNEVDQAEKDDKKAFLINGLALKHLALAANEYGSILVHYSTDYVFDGGKKSPYCVTDKPHPINRYGESKLLGENHVRDLCDHYFLIRTSWVFGRGNMNFAKKVQEWSKNKKEISVVDDQVSTPTYTVDLAKATIDLLSTKKFGLFHITNTGSCSRYDWAQYILQQVGWKGKLVRAKSADFKTAAERPAFSVLDNFGTDEVLGYSLPSWQDATSRFLKEKGVIL